jgi:transcription termination factor NusB
MYFKRKDRVFFLNVFYNVESVVFNYSFLNKYNNSIVKVLFINYYNIKIIKYTAINLDINFNTQAPQKSYVLFYTKILYQRLNVIDCIINIHLLKNSFTHLNILEKYILRVSTFEILFTRIPIKIVIDEALKISNIYIIPIFLRLVNGILNNIVTYKSIK